MKKIQLTENNTAEIIASFKDEGGFKQFTSILADTDAFEPYVKRGSHLTVQKLERIPNGSLALIQYGNKLVLRKFYAFHLGVVLQDPETNTPDLIEEEQLFSIPVEPLAAVSQIEEP